MRRRSYKFFITVMLRNFLNLLFFTSLLFTGCSNREETQDSSRSGENNFLCQETSDETSGIASNEISESTDKSKIINDTLALNYESVVSELENHLSDDFIIKPYLYYVVVSNLSEDETGQLMENTITKATDCFYNDYFRKKPDELTTIFLFKDEKSYRYWANKLYADTDLSIYGYYKPDYRAMLMNINTGSGTLVHEMTHALVRFDFPDIPSWFNEGLGSLYERCSLNDGMIKGYVNWRLPSLQEALADGSYTGLDVMLRTDYDEFYGDNSGFYYSQARYLCMFLQEKGLLRAFYKAFRDNYSEDVTGRTILERVYGKDLTALESEYITWVGTLEYE